MPAPPESARVALVTGAGGQDGSYLVERLMGDGYAVHAVVRPAGLSGGGPSGPAVHQVDLVDTEGLHAVVDAVEPDEVYNLGGVTSVAASWEQPELTARVNGLAALTLLQSCLRLQERRGRAVRFLQASSAEIFGEPDSTPQDERTPVRPVSPYGAAKAFAHHSVGVYRHRGLHAVSAILYNHESPRRPTGFVTRKISRAVADIARTGRGQLRLGNLEARRDWGWAPDYVDAMVRAMRHDRPADYVVATGQAHSVRDVVDEAFRHVGLDDWDHLVSVDPALLRPADPSVLTGDASLARRVLGWEPTVGFASIVARMVDADLALDVAP